MIAAVTQNVSGSVAALNYELWGAIIGQTGVSAMLQDIQLNSAGVKWSTPKPTLLSIESHSA